MGYSTDFTGHFKLDRPLTVAQRRYLKAFAETRRMQRNAHVTETYPDPIRHAVGLPVGAEGGYYVGAESDGQMGQSETADIIDYNSPPVGQPGLWNHWEPTKDGEGIQWSGAEKFYSYLLWLEYLINHFLKPWNLKLSGEVDWQGEDAGDAGKIIVVGNVIKTKKAKRVYEQ